MALELVAAWAQTLSPTQMTARLTTRSDLLVSRSKDAAERHRTLWAAIEWSFRLLAPPLQRLLPSSRCFAADGRWSQRKQSP